MRKLRQSTLIDIRHQRRIKIVQELYAFLLNKESAVSKKTHDILVKKSILDRKIQDAAQKYVVSKIAKVDLAILRLALYELLVEKKEPPKVIINEAVELAKALAGEKSPGFINAVLGKIYEHDKLRRT